MMMMMMIMIRIMIMIMMMAMRMVMIMMMMMVLTMTLTAVSLIALVHNKCAACQYEVLPIPSLSMKGIARKSSIQREGQEKVPQTFNKCHFHCFCT